MDRSFAQKLFKQGILPTVQLCNRLNCNWEYKPALLKGELIRNMPEHVQSFKFPLNKCHLMTELVLEIEDKEQLPHKVNRVINENLNCILTGNQGTGKTCLALTIALEYMIAYEFPSIEFINWTDLLALISKAAGIDEEAQERFKSLKSSNLLIIDDFGLTNISTDNKDAGIYDLLNSREMNSSATIFTTNRNSAQLIEKVGKAVFDRMTTRCLVMKFFGQSQRERLTF